jgi:two-component system chemotaxis response regulator CheB
MNFDLIVIGGSLGGAEALGRLLGALTPEFPACIAVVLHTPESSPRLMAEILGKRTQLQVTYASGGEQLRKGHVFLAPPRFHLVVHANGNLALSTAPKINHSKPAVDALFESAAGAFGKQVIGVVLSGGDGDGTEGLKAIKRQGGLSVIQSPVDAKAPGMPTTALLHDSPDYTVLVEELGPLLRAVVEERRHTHYNL